MNNFKMILKGEKFFFLAGGYCASAIEEKIAETNIVVEVAETVDACQVDGVCGTFYETDLTLVRKFSPINIVAITSTTILPLDGTYSVARIETPDLSGLKHYIGHPATANIVETLGAVKAETKLFSGLQVGESQLCFSIKQGLSDRSQGGTAVNQEVSAGMLECRVVTRIA